MKRDLELIRKILQWLESRQHGYPQDDEICQIDGYTEDEIGFHVYLLGEAGLAKTLERTYIGAPSPMAHPLHLTWAGYEFLDASKDETLWKKAKEVVIKPAGGVAFDVLLEYLKAQAKAQFGLP